MMIDKEHVGFVKCHTLVNVLALSSTVSLQALNITIVSVEKDDGSHSGLAGLPVVKPTLILVTTVTAFAMTRLF